MTRTALIVDDSRSMRQMVAFTLTSAGFSVVEAENGADALTKLDSHDVSVVITDLNMPVMDGLTFIRQLRTRGAHRFTPVLMLTTEAQPEVKAEGKAAGATGWIVKPFKQDVLVNVVKKVLP